MPVRGATVTSSAESCELLAHGEIKVKGRMPYSSNATFLVECEDGDAKALAIYKPARGERPLWDFPRGLYKREIAAYHLSEALGWGLVPLTLAREDGPFGAGSLQLFVDADFEQHYFTLHETPAHRERLERVCAFDLIANNADRKSGHCLLGPDGAIYAIDNGLCFHVEPKLRTVIWDFAGSPIPGTTLDGLRRFARGRVPATLAELLTEEECRALRARARALVERGCFPPDDTGYRYPWPLV